MWDHSRSITIYSPHHETTVVRIETDNGIVGWGEAQSPVSPNTTATIVRELVRPLVMGRDPFDIEGDLDGQLRCDAGARPSDGFLHRRSRRDGHRVVGCGGKGCREAGA